MSRFEHLIFVCTNERKSDDPKGSCAAKGSRALLDRLKELTHEHKLKGKVRITNSGCLDLCAKGCSAVAFSSTSQNHETWYTELKPEDADELFKRHVLQNKIFEK